MGGSQTLIQKYFEEQIFEDIKYIEETIEDYEFLECKFINCTFELCAVINCKFLDCVFENCNVISPRVNQLKMRHSEFIRCNLIGIHWRELLPGGRVLEPVRKFTECYLKYNSFVDMSFRKFDFSENAIQESTFEECNLMESKFKNCRLEMTQIIKCDIRNADFRGAMGYQIDIANNRLKGARFSFPEVVNLLDGLGIKID